MNANISKSPAPLHPLLAGLSPVERAGVADQLRPVEHRRGARLVLAGEAVGAVHLVRDGLVAIMGRAANGASVETGLVGPGGLVGVSAALGATALAQRDAVALTPVRSFAIEALALARVAARVADLRRDLMASVNARIAQGAQLCVCASLHTVEQRLARWLLDAVELRGPRPIDLTHDTLADLLGVRRASVTAGLHLLEGEQAVRCRRGRIEIRDVAALAERSCGCHRLLAETRRPSPFRADPAAA